MAVSMASMHEEVHEGTRGEQEERQELDDVSPVLGKQEVRDYQEKTNQHYLGPGHRPMHFASLLVLLVVHLTLQCWKG